MRITGPVVDGAGSTRQNLGHNTNVATLTHGALSVSLPYNPNNIQWQYSLNTQYISTYGGYVEQLLSVSTQDINVTGDAGTRKRLLKLFNDLVDIKDEQIKTQAPCRLVMPLEMSQTGSLNLSVWVSSIDTGFDTTTVTFPYRLVLQSNDSNFGQIKDLLLSVELSKITASLGYANGIGVVDGGFYQGIKKSSKLSLSQLSQFIMHPENQIPESNYGTLIGDWNW